MINKYFALSLVAASVALASCSSDDDDDDDNGGETPDYVSPEATPGEGGSPYDTIVNSDQHTSLRLAIDTAGLADTLDDETLEFTVFAPDDAAFASLNTDETPTAVDDLLADVDALTRVLQYHVSEGTSDSAAITAAIAAATEEAPATLATLLEGESVTLSTSDTAPTGVAVDGIDVLAADLVPEVAEGETTVGVVHSIGAVLDVPEATDEDPDNGEDPDGGDNGGGDVTDGAGTAQSALESAGNYTEFLAAFGAESYDTNDWTVFAPTNEAVTNSTVALDAQNHIVVNDGSLTVEDLLAAGEVTVNSTAVFMVGGTSAEDLTVGGFPVTQLAVGDAGTIVYSIDGVLAP